MRKLFYAVIGVIILVFVAIIMIISSSNSQFKDFLTTGRISALADDSNKFERDIVLNCLEVKPHSEENIAIKELISKMTERRPNWRFILLSSDNEFDEFDSVPNVKLEKIRADYSVMNGIFFNLLDFMTFFRLHNKLVQLRFFNQLCIDDKCLLLWNANVSHQLGIKGLLQISTIPSLVSFDVPDKYQTEDAGNDRNFIENAVKTSNKIITLSEFSKRRIVEQFDVPSDFVKVISLKVGTRYSNNIQKDASESILNKHKVQSGKYIIFIPSTKPYQNQINLISAFEKYSEGADGSIKLLIVCRDAQINYYRQLISAGKLANNIIIAENVSKDEENMLIYHALAYIQPSLYEGVGASIIRVMFMEVPILCSNTGSLAEVASGAALLFNPTDVDDISSAIFKIAGDEDLRRRLIDLCTNRRNDFQNIEAMADEYLNVFEEVMNEEKARVE
ncbi:MAG: glycosyltransferase family 4 protein [Alphaproteobacteria bacterium]|nr:glycosyltransferase family 4 protein [Alphaproteobacteria bacterium]